MLNITHAILKYMTYVENVRKMNMHLAFTSKPKEVKSNV